MSNLQPTHYSSTEMGRWRVWPPFCILSPVVLAQRALKHVKVCEYNGETLYAHALAFGDVTRGFGNFPRWDCINGWTKKEPALAAPEEITCESLPAPT